LLLQWLLIPKNLARIRPAEATQRALPSNAAASSASDADIQLRANSFLVIPSSAASAPKQPRLNALGEVQSAARALNSDERMAQLNFLSLEQQLGLAKSARKRHLDDSNGPAKKRPRILSNEEEQAVTEFVTREIGSLKRAKPVIKELRQALSPYMRAPTGLSRDALLFRVHCLLQATGMLASSPMSISTSSTPSSVSSGSTPSTTSAGTAAPASEPSPPAPSTSSSTESAMDVDPAPVASARSRRQSAVLLSDAQAARALADMIMSDLDKQLE
jgi:hypothetical protein